MKPVKEQILAVVYGGFSSEVEISVKSGKSVARWLRNAGRTVHEVLILREGWWAVIPGGEEGERRYPIDRNDFSFTGHDGKKVTFDKVFNRKTVIDGIEDNADLRDSGIYMSRDIMLRKGDAYDPHEAASRVGLPAFVKPCGGGSSFGVTKVRTPEEIDAALEAAFAESDTVIVEKGIVGREIDCAVYSSPDGPKALPLIEIVPRNEFFDYEAKYLGASSEICPAPIPEADRIRIQDAAVRIFGRLGCRGLVRMDFILGVDGHPYFLEVNPNPGMTDASLVPQMVREAGMSMEDFLTGIIDRTGED